MAIEVDADLYPAWPDRRGGPRAGRADGL